MPKIRRRDRVNKKSYKAIRRRQTFIISCSLWICTLSCLTRPVSLKTSAEHCSFPTCIMYNQLHPIDSRWSVLDVGVMAWKPPFTAASQFAECHPSVHLNQNQLLMNCVVLHGKSFFPKGGWPKHGSFKGLE